MNKLSSNLCSISSPVSSQHSQLVSSLLFSVQWLSCVKDASWWVYSILITVHRKGNLSIWAMIGIFDRELHWKKERDILGSWKRIKWTKRPYGSMNRVDCFVGNILNRKSHDKSYMKKKVKKNYCIITGKKHWKLNFLQRVVGVSLLINKTIKKVSNVEIYDQIFQRLEVQESKNI